MFDKMKQLYQLQSKARRIQKELKRTEITAEALDGKIVVVLNGEQKLQDLSIDDDLLDPSKKRELENGLKDAFAEATKEAQKIAAEQMKEISGDLGLPNVPGR